MSYCPRCQQSVDSQAIACPHCRNLLKAHGHPGIPLYRASGQAFLCQSCHYHLDDSCTFPQRPFARECTLYRSRLIPTAQIKTTTNRFRPAWLRPYLWMLILGIGIFALLLIVL